ncbi:hypothetical protein [Mesorhizobium sp. WSM3876]|uniref:hypothetical protein n=1 Tax=Mesorhizobium sp. WSM3876 TaxID=422277 RepID=UPI000BAECA18|nr:hypothetical protein [Mesorhizobium sp. WSM3876]PBB88351.1 hypothetical protein CK216_00985 [Mesorhizobium sp. WSM3876]
MLARLAAGQICIIPATLVQPELMTSIRYRLARPTLERNPTNLVLPDCDVVQWTEISKARQHAPNPSLAKPLPTTIIPCIDCVCDLPRVKMSNARTDDFTPVCWQVRRPVAESGDARTPQSAIGKGWCSEPTFVSCARRKYSCRSSA